MLASKRCGWPGTTDSRCLAILKQRKFHVALLSTEHAARAADRVRAAMRDERPSPAPPTDALPARQSISRRPTAPG